MNWLVKALLLILFIVLFTLIFYTINPPLFNLQALSYLSSISITTGVLIASLTYLRDKNNKNDEVLFGIAKSNFAEFIGLFEELENSRVVWIRAARLLLNTVEIREEIKTTTFQKAFDAIAEDTRSKLYRSLKHEGGSLPVAFFFGIDDWKSCTLNIEQIKSGRIDNYPKTDLLDTKSVVSIYNFINQSIYEIDPLDSVDEWVKEPLPALGILEGAVQFVKSENEA